MLRLSGFAFALSASFAVFGFGSAASAQGLTPWGMWGDAPPRASKPSYLGAPPAIANSPGLSSGGGKPSISPRTPQTVSFANGFSAGSVVIDTQGRKLYYTLSGNSAYVYPIAVGKQGFAWTGVEKVSRIVDWPDWIPPKEMHARKGGLPLKMTGGLRNPLGAKAIYLGNTLYRIHGTNDSKSIGSASSSGCFRMHNSDVVHLADHVGPGTTVYVMRRLPKSGTIMPPSAPKVQEVKQATPPAGTDTPAGDAPSAAQPGTSPAQDQQPSSTGQGI